MRTMKYKIRKYGKQTLDQAEQSVLRALNKVTNQDMNGYYRKCGIAV